MNWKTQPDLVSENLLTAVQSVTGAKSAIDKDTLQLR
jgi:hypothetical protein